MKVIFLDYDGVIRMPPAQDGGWAIITPDADFCGDSMKRVADACRQVGAKIVISSDWRDFGKEECLKHISKHLPAEMIHEDWKTERLQFRWIEVALWLEKHPEVSQFAILEDTQRHFDGAFPRIAERVVWCNNRHGFVPSLYSKLCAMFLPD